VCDAFFEGWNAPDGAQKWSAAHIFHYFNNYRSYRGILCAEYEMTFGEAIEALKAGARVTRAGWTGKNTWLTLITSKPIGMSPYFLLSTENWDSLHEVQEIPPYVESAKALPDVVPWVATHADMLAEDWQKL
jgi:Protein of unknown function (DUF2829)